MLVGMKTLKEFIAAIGDTKTARLLGMKPRTVAAYRRGERRPKPADAARIVKIAATHPAGPVDYAGIYAPKDGA
jgi:transcriptional regulator with XRE-family HTH domain